MLTNTRMIFGIAPQVTRLPRAIGEFPLSIIFDIPYEDLVSYYSVWLIASLEIVLIIMFAKRNCSFQINRSSKQYTLWTSFLQKFLHYISNIMNFKSKTISWPVIKHNITLQKRKHFFYLISICTAGMERRGVTIPFDCITFFVSALFSFYDANSNKSLFLIYCVFET